MKALILISILGQFNYRANDYGFKPGQVWVAVHDSAFILYTEDYGNSWNFINPGTSFGFFDIFFIDSLKGWTGGVAGEIRHSNDGGSTWSRQVLGDTKWISRIQFLDTLHGYASAGDAIVKVTKNGGLTWTRVFTPFTGIDFYGIHFVDTLTGFICSGLPTIQGVPAYVLKSIDGGYTWDTLFVFDGYDLFDLHFFDENNGIVVGGVDASTQPVVFITHDGGNTWDTIVPPGYYLRALHFIDNNTGWACGMFGTIIKTTDGGYTWTLQSTGVIGTLFDIDFLDSLNGVASGQDAILITQDGGNTWQNVGIKEKSYLKNDSKVKNNILSIKKLKNIKGSIYALNGRKKKEKFESGVYFIKPGNYVIKIISFK